MIVMEHNTIKRILIGLFFCVVLFALSFLLEEKSKTVSSPEDKSETEIVSDSQETER